MLCARCSASTRRTDMSWLAAHADTENCYLGTVGLLTIKSFIGLALPWTAFLVAMSMGSAAVGILLLGFAAWYFARKLEH